MKTVKEIYPSEKELKGITVIASANIDTAQEALKPHRHLNSMEIVNISKGVQTYEVDGKYYNVRGGEVFLTYENELHSTGNHKEEFSSLQWIQIDLSSDDGFLGLEKEIAQELIAALRNIKCRHFKGSERLKNNILEAIKTYYTNNKLKYVIINNLIVNFLLSVIELSKREKKNVITEDIRRTLDYIEGNYMNNITIAELSEIAIVSESRYKLKFKEQLGMPPGQYILIKRIEQCKEKLKNTDETVKSICLSNGFKSEIYFSKAFKKITGITPVEYRKSQR